MSSGGAGGAPASTLAATLAEAVAEVVAEALAETGGRAGPEPRALAAAAPAPMTPGAHRTPRPEEGARADEAGAEGGASRADGVVVFRSGGGGLAGAGLAACSTTRGRRAMGGVSAIGSSEARPRDGEGAPG